MAGARGRLPPASLDFDVDFDVNFDIKFGFHADFKDFNIFLYVFAVEYINLYIIFWINISKKVTKTEDKTVAALTKGRRQMNIPVIQMTMQSDLMGKALVAFMLLLSLWSWALIFTRVVSLNRISASNKSFWRKFQDLRSLPEVDRMPNADLNTPMGQLAKVGSDEFHRIISDVRSHTKVKDWSFFLDAQLSMAKERIESIFAGLVAPFDRGVFLLAMISSASPFLGLLGTVWGIMNSFYEIGNQGSASLPVVAPGIAAALITTIVGLAVAIPALFFYNYCNNKAERAADEMEELKDLLIVRLKREIFSTFFAEGGAQHAAPAGGYQQR